VMEKVRENVSGVRVLKSFAQEPGSERDFARTNQRLVDENMSLVRVHGVFHPLIELLGGATMAIILWVGGAGGHSGPGDSGRFRRVRAVPDDARMAHARCRQAVSLIQRGSASLQRINALLALSADIGEPDHPRPLAGTSIETRKLTFVYPGSADRDHVAALST